MKFRLIDLVIFPFVEWTILAGIMDNDYSVAPKVTCNNNEMNDCILPRRRHSPVGYHLFCFPLDTEDTHLKMKKIWNIWLFTRKNLLNLNTKFQYNMPIVQCIKYSQISVQVNIKWFNFFLRWHDMKKKI